MKKIVIFAYTLDMGGAEKVLVDYLNVLKNQYKIDLVLIKKQGELLGDVPPNINVIQLRKNIFEYILFRYISIYRKFKINKIVTKDKYDIAIGFIEGRSATWVADIKCDIKRIAWIHNDVNSFDIGISDKEIIKTYPKMNKIIVVSEQSKINFYNKYHIDRSKIEVLYNLIDEKKILKLSMEEVEKNDKFTFINVGRMRPQKRQDRLVKIGKHLKQAGYDFKIQILGSGSEEENIKKLIKENNVEDVIELKGLVKNPYPYIKQADCVVVSSDFEGYSIAIKEALLLKKIIISTDVSGVREIFDNNKFGIISEKSTEDLELKMRQMLDKKIDIETLKNNLEKFNSGNDKIINQLIKIIEE